MKKNMRTDLFVTMYEGTDRGFLVLQLVEGVLGATEGTHGALASGYVTCGRTSGTNDSPAC